MVPNESFNREEEEKASVEGVAGAVGEEFGILLIRLELEDDWK